MIADVARCDVKGREREVVVGVCTCVSGDAPEKQEQHTKYVGNKRA